MEKDKKDIVEHIIKELKAKQELPYKEGSWEHFQQQSTPVVSKKPKIVYWAASAAAILLAIWAVNQWSIGIAPDTTQSIVAKRAKDTESATSNASPDSAGEDPIRSAKGSAVLAEQKEVSSANPLFSDQIPDALQSPVLSDAWASAPKVTGSRFSALSLTAPFSPARLNAAIEPTGTIKLDADHSMDLETSDSRSVQSLAHATQQVTAADGKAPELRDRRFRFMDKFQLGIFVSPNSTNEQFNFGGGVLINYQLSKNLSIRTGLAFNKYEASQMRDPVTSPEMQVRTNLNTSQMLTSDGAIQAKVSNALILPNVNAITGNVQALEVPLDLKLDVAQGFYISSGITYAAILQQNRYAHYIENVNKDLFQDGLPENQGEVQQATQQISRSIKTEDENVRSNQFGGFVNFSLGKKVKLNKGISLSVEPYMKLPVGSFQRADMNYTNGGIRIITNF